MSAAEAHRFRYADTKAHAPRMSNTAQNHRPCYKETVATYHHLLSTTFEAHNPLRVIAHCDVDAAYAQFEAARLGIDCTKHPIAVLQWSALIAVNYVARAYGVGRFNCTLEQAKERCPDLQFIHVASYGPGDEAPQYYEQPSPRTHKISLDLYRRESRKIMDIFQRCLENDSTSGLHVGFDLAPVVADGWAPTVLQMQGEKIDEDILFEKASIDESFFDLSLYVRKQLLRRFPFLDIRPELEMLSPDERMRRLDTPLPPPPLSIQQELVKKSWTLLGAWWPDQDSAASSQQVSQDSADNEAFPGLSWSDVAHAIAAERMIAVRKHIFDHLGYTTSAGVAGNKALAKLCSSHRKPCSQTVLLPRYVFDFLAPLPFRKIRFLGGKLGSEIADVWGQSTVGELWSVPMEEMQQRFGANGRWLHELFRGIDLSEVNRRSANRSMMSSKNFQPPLSSQTKGLQWLSIMASELGTRLQEEREEFPLSYPRFLVLRYVLAGNAGVRSQQTPFGFVRNEDLAKEIYAKAEKLWNQNIGQRMDHSVGHDRVGVCVLSLAFAGLERQSRDQKQLHAFFSAPKRKREDDDNGCAKIPLTQRSASPPSANTPRPSPPPEPPAHPPPPARYTTVLDPDTQTDMAQWACPKCDHVINVPQFDDPDDAAPGNARPSYERLLDQLRVEHEHWHMAVDLAADW